MAMRTINLKLYKPSSIKRKIIDDAIQNYSNAFRYLLIKANSDLDNIRDNFMDVSGRYRAFKVAGWVDKKRSRELNQFGIEPFKDSLKLDFAMTLAGYLTNEAGTKQVSYPLSKKLSHDPRPLLFCRYDPNRDFCLLYDHENDKYYAKLYLMNNKSENRKVIKSADHKRLTYIHKNGELLEESSRKVRFILVPLSFGKWQEDYLRLGLEDPGIFKTARLIKRNKDYFLSISLEMDEPEQIETKTYMGISRGLTNPLNYAIADRNGGIMNQGFINLPDIKKNAKNSLPSGFLHKLANKISDKALKNQSRVIVEQLVSKGDKLQWQNGKGKSYIPVLGCRDYNTLVKMLEYKLPAIGLPAPVKVSPNGILTRCPQCGMNTKKNRFSHHMFICTGCGKTADIESLGSINLARRLADNGGKVIVVRAEKTPVGIKFINKELGLDCCIKPNMDIHAALTREIERIIGEFFNNLSCERKKEGFNKKYSLMKRLQLSEDVAELIQVVD